MAPYKLRQAAHAPAKEIAKHKTHQEIATMVRSMTFTPDFLFVVLPLLHAV